MSDPLRIALVAEGPTDRIAIEAVLRAMLAERPFVLTQSQPEGALVFGELGTGWVGVYRWCKQAVQRGNGHLAGDRLVFQNYDLLVLHLDADVAGKRYGDGSITSLQTDGQLPCEADCPPPSATTDALRDVLLSWCNETTPPDKPIVCMPSKSTEAWVVAALFPSDRAMRQGIECFPDPESRLGQQRKARRIRKGQRDYRANSVKFEQEWPRLVAPGGLGEALRFQVEFLAVTARTSAQQTERRQ